MQDKVTFEYAIIRLVPKVEREEFFNIGVILFSKRKKFLGVKYKINQKKFDAYSCDLDLEAINNYLKSWELICKGDASAGVIGQFELSDRFRWLAASRSTIIQSSKTHAGLTDNPEKELKAIFESCVL
ncbi:hypothetical protein DFQ11_10166 [Winogradskyella epiphytica]|uniref:DUF3037 family protein n=1 Tax=Winogradskyella epiphytica TaxID=262005 RepID=A0A2V4XGN3_9FLAO|nr:DUF3037 domain-containing protein [Winogradskyella epiphytica]PYE82641.1 hypothetical protein DFQ11_10166 [Winogradskyella epiphytica]GGW72434.1 hypothetical protein GCM10008085_25840 [Winogradskyella epiphytica]